MRYLIALLAALGIASVGAQTVETTPNLITSGSTHTWTGVSTGPLPTNAMPGGPGALYDPNTNTIHFSYGSATVAQTFAINQALQGTGITVQGYNYSWQINNNNYDNRQGNTDTLTASILTYTVDGALRRTDSWTYNTKFDWTTFSGTVNYTNPGLASTFGNLRVQFVGMDSGYWAGYFGPQVRNVQIGLNYTVDPCATNPAYSPTCPGFNTVNYSNNLVPNPNGYAVSGASIDQSYAINQALGLSGSGVMIHGFQWGYVANANGPYCGSWDFGFLGCLDNRLPNVTTNVSITSSTGSTLYSATRNYQNSYNTTTYQYLFPSSRNLSTLGNFNFSATTNDQAYIGSIWSSALYTPDPCVVDPLSSATCPGYAQAVFNQQCTANPLYDSACPGYAQALFTQQCNANQLSNPACPGYAQAYLDYQCSLNPLYSTVCVGYQTAVTTCNQNPLSHSFCPAYQTATTECQSNSLYASYCTGYQTTLAQCTVDPLSNVLCPGYQFAYSCSLDGLYSKDCPNYGDAYAKKNILGIGTTATTTTSSTTTIVLAQANTDPVAQAAPVVADPVVNNVVSTKSTTANAEANPAAAVKVTTASSPAAAPATTQSAQQEKKSETTTTGAKTEEKSADKPRTAREQLAEQRREAAKKEAVTRGKELADTMGKAADMAAQVEVQNVVIQAMGFTPGFDAYNNSTLPDGILYPPVQAYRDQRTVDNAQAERFLNGSSEVRHQMMIEQQYNLGK